MGGLRLSLPVWAVAALMLLAVALIVAAVWRLTGEWGWAALAAGVLLAAWSVIMVELRPSVATHQRPRGPRPPMGG